jgi:hypothetical protein
MLRENNYLTKTSKITEDQEMFSSQENGKILHHGEESAVHEPREM